MQPLNQNFLEALKNKKVDLNLSKRLANTGSTSHRKGSQASSGRGSSPMDTLANVSTLGSTSSKFRVRTLNNNTNTTATEENILGKSSSRLLPPRPTTASRKNEPVKPIHSQAMLSTSTRPSTNQGRRSSQSSKSLLMKSESTRMFEDIDRENDINFLNMDDDNEFDARIREEMEVFNDIADLDEVKLADILNVDVDMLEKMTKAEMKVDLSFNSLQFAGDVMRNLCQLKLNNSIIVSLRDVGNSFPNLKILWVSKCGLQSLAGLSAFPKLQELYAPYNNIKELSDLIFHSHLQVLDLEANEISDINTMFNLMNLDVLNNLTISANPISKIKGYEKQIITEFLPRLELINDKTPEEVNAQDDTEMNDDLDLGGLGGNSERDNNRIQALYDKFEKLHMFSVKEFDSHTRQIILNDMGTEPTEEELIMMSVKKSAKKAKANPLEEDEFGRLSIDVSKSKKKALQRPQSSKGRIGSSKGSSIFTDTDKFKDFGLAASDLTHQAGEAFAGNPLKALRHKRKNQFTSGFENVEGETIAKPKDILKLIEEFEINDESEEDGNKKYDDVFSASLQEGTDNDNDINIDDEIASKSTEKENRTHTEGDLDAIPQHDRANSLSQPGTRSLKDDDFKRSLRPVAPRIRVFSQEKRDSIELPSHFPPKDMSMQDIRNQLNSKARVKIQIKTKKAPAIIPVNPANAGRLTSVKVDEVK